MELILGKAKSGKTTHIYSEIASRIQSGLAKKTMLIVPEQYTLEAEKQLILALKSQGFIGVEVVSLKRLSHKVLQEVGRDIGTYVTKTGKQMLLKRVFLMRAMALKYYQNAYEKSGFIEKFLDLIQEFKQNLVDATTIGALAEQLTDNGLLKFKLEDIADILSAYEHAKSSAYFDDEDLMNAFIETIPESQWLATMTIFVDGFDSFTVQEHAAIKALNQKANRMVMTLPYDEKNNHTFKHTVRTYERLIQTEALESDVVEIVLENRYIDAPFEHLAENLSQFVYPQSPKTVLTPIYGFSAASIASEVAYCAVEILRCQQEHGYRFDEIAVVTNALERYTASVERVFNAYGIPFFLDEKVGVDYQPLTHWIHSLLMIPIDVRNHAHAIRLLKTGLIPCDASSVDELELYSKAHGLSLLKFLKPFEKEPIGQLPLESLEALRQIVKVPIETMLSLSNDKEATVRDYVLGVFNLLETMAVQTALTTLAEQLEASGNHVIAQEISSVWNAYTHLFDEMVMLMGDQKMPFRDWVKLFQVGIESMEIGRLPLEKNVVLVGSMDRSKSHPIKVLFLLGLNEGVLPESGGFNPIFQESEKSLLVKDGKKLMADFQMFVDKEQFNIYMTLTRQTDKLYLSYAKSDAEGNTLRPSPLISKMMKLNPSIEFIEEVRQLEDSGGKPFWIYGEEPTYHKLSIALRKFLDGYALDETWLEVLAWFKKASPERYQHLMNGMLHNNLFGKLAPKATEQLYPLPLKTSVSQLETYVQCPFKYFVKSGLAPKRKKTFKVDYPDIGLLFHTALETFGKTLHEKGLLWQEIPDDVCEEMVDHIVKEMVDNDLYQSKFSYRYMASKLKRVSLRAIQTLRHQLSKGTFEPTAFELAFDENVRGVPPIVIELEGQRKIFLRGVIDRIDLLKTDDKTYVKIIDYKSGTKQLTLTEVYYGLQMQLLVYLRAMLGHPEYFKSNALYPGGAFYFKIDDPMIDSAEKVKGLVENALNDTLKMDGLCLDATEVLKGLDFDLVETGKSDVIKVKFKTSGELTKDSKAVDLETFNALMLWTETLIKDIGTSILEGEMPISPCKIGQFVSCQNCDYSAICQFDTKFEGNEHRVLKTLDDASVIEKVMGKEAPTHVDE